LRTHKTILIRFIYILTSFPKGAPYKRAFQEGFQIVSEKFYTVDDFNPHITKFNKMIIMATIMKLRQYQLST
jgi:hypothetical protein